VETLSIHPLETISISKYFGSIRANEDIDLTLKKGEIHTILGENGAGKSTLMNIISGLYRPDKGNILINGEKAVIRNPRDAIRHGIHLVHQKFMLFQIFTVLENIILGNEPTKGIRIDIRKASRRISHILEESGLALDLNRIVENLPVGIQQRIEIVKGLYRKARILLLDEPTSVLTPQEIEEFFNLLHRLSKKGVSIIFITHKLKEALHISDRITIMRHGKVIQTTTPDQTNESMLAELMVGRGISTRIKKVRPQTKEIRINIKCLKVLDDRNRDAVNNVSLTIHKGEILGIAGVQGNGQSELVEALTGLRPMQSGSIYLNGCYMPSMNSRNLYEHGFGHIPEQRLKHGMIASYSIADNQVLNNYFKPPFAVHFIRNMTAVMNHSKSLIEKFNIYPPTPEILASNLSGGNQQKVVLSRELSRNIQFLVANHPTRGLDVGSSAFIHSQLMEIKNKGTAILLISSDLDEIFSLSDRIAVMFDGRIHVILPSHKFSRKTISLYMSGVKTSK